MGRTTFLLATVVLLVLFLAFWSRHHLFDDSSPEVDSVVLVERIDQVLKLVAVEGRFSEIYDYKDYWGYDLSPLRKKALIRVTALVSVGFDMEDSNVEVDPSRQIVSLKKLPEPRILSIDTSLDYYDITEGTFNSFSEEDFTRFQYETKELIREKVQESDLYGQANRQARAVLAVLSAAVAPAGWEIRY